MSEQMQADPNDGFRYDGDRHASHYDAWYDGRLDTEAAVSFLVSVGPGRSALELGVGTGRVAIPLAEAGFAVTGLDASPVMLDQLRQKAGGSAVSCVEGDMVDIDLSDSFDLVFVLFSTFFLLPSQQSQVTCLERAAARMRAGGHLVIEAFVPDANRYRANQDVHIEHLGAGSVRVELSQHYPSTQVIQATRVQLSAAGIELFPHRLRYATPAEIDLMARLAGLDLVCRYGDFGRQPFGCESRMHVSVYRRPEGTSCGPH